MKFLGQDENNPDFKLLHIMTQVVNMQITKWLGPKFPEMQKKKKEKSSEHREGNNLEAVWRCLSDAKMILCCDAIPPPMKTAMWVCNMGTLKTLKAAVLN